MQNWKWLLEYEKNRSVTADKREDNPKGIGKKDHSNTIESGYVSAISDRKEMLSEQLISTERHEHYLTQLKYE